jgi:2-polyprenyl-3-methyl-5-hydroxy-6-metoxy-1,4-benzoquinol methylase
LETITFWLGVNLRVTEYDKTALEALKKSVAKPALYKKSTKKFWDDPYISGQMLKLHLNPEVDSASRSKTTIETESAFIIQKAGIAEGKAVLDLGCGPGLYVREFAKTGAKVTGVDLSEHSIRYANENIKPSFSNVDFKQMNYLQLASKDEYDVATLIFYDFCVLNPDEQVQLLRRINQALKPGGILVFDVISERFKVQETTQVTTSLGDGFWTAEPYIEIANTYLYENPKTMGQQYTIITEDERREVIRLYTRLFSQPELKELLNLCGFRIEGMYKNFKGDPLSEGSETYGVFAKKV